MLIRGSNLDLRKFEIQYPFVTSYINKRKKNDDRLIFLSHIAVPVKSYIKFAVDRGAHGRKIFLDDLDLGSLQENNIDIQKYIPTKRFGSGEILTPDDIKKISKKLIG